MYLKIGGDLDLGRVGGRRGGDNILKREVEDPAAAEAEPDSADGGYAIGLEGGNDLVERRAGVRRAVGDKPFLEVELFLRSRVNCASCKIQSSSRLG